MELLYWNVSFQRYNFVNKIGLISDPSLTEHQTGHNASLGQLSWANNYLTALSPVLRSQISLEFLIDFVRINLTLRSCPALPCLVDGRARSWLRSGSFSHCLNNELLMYFYQMALGEKYRTVDCLMICECDLSKNCVSSPRPLPKLIYPAAIVSDDL